MTSRCSCAHTTRSRTLTLGQPAEKIATSVGGGLAVVAVSIATRVRRMCRLRSASAASPANRRRATSASQMFVRASYTFSGSHASNLCLLHRLGMHATSVRARNKTSITGHTHPRLPTVLKMTHLTAERRVRALFYWAHVLGTKARMCLRTSAYRGANCPGLVAVDSHCDTLASSTLVLGRS